MRSGHLPFWGPDGYERAALLQLLESPDRLARLLAAVSPKVAATLNLLEGPGALVVAALRDARIEGREEAELSVPVGSLRAESISNNEYRHSVTPRFPIRRLYISLRLAPTRREGLG